jgi:hypothetical protein
MKHIRPFAFLLIPLFLSACNLYGGLSKPSNDDQYLVAARSCLDHGDYECARQNYNALSASYVDIAVSEGSLNTLAQNQIFSITDLVSSLGSGLGSGSSFSFLAEALAVRGVTTGSARTTIKTVFDNDAVILDPKLKSFSQFLAALAMVNQVLANAVGTDGKLTAGDIVTPSAVTACKASNDCGACLATNVGCQCTTPAGTALTYNNGDLTNFSSSPATWAGSATIQKLIQAAIQTTTSLTAFSGGSNGLGPSLQAISALSTNALLAGAGPEACVRQQLISILGL